jgi:hypothetical protein
MLILLTFPLRRLMKRRQLVASVLALERRIVKEKILL